MELHNTFSVPIPVDEAWKVLTDVERIAPCMPGAQLQEVEGDEYRGVVKVKVGPITAQYKGKATFLEKDDAAKKAVLRAEGRDTRGQGNANANITMTMQGAGERTDVTVDTDLNITGRVAQFGRGVLADVTEKLLGQFVDCLETKIAGGETPAGSADRGSEDAPATKPTTDDTAAPAAVPSEVGVDGLVGDDERPAGEKVEVPQAAAGVTDQGERPGVDAGSEPAAPIPAAMGDSELRTSASPEAAAEAGADSAAGAAAAFAAKQDAEPALVEDAARTAPAVEDRAATPDDKPAVRTIDHPEPEPIDVLDHTPDYVKVGAAGAGALLVAIILFLLLRRRSR